MWGDIGVNVKFTISIRWSLVKFSFGYEMVKFTIYGYHRLLANFVFFAVMW